METGHPQNSNTCFSCRNSFLLFVSIHGYKAPINIRQYMIVCHKRACWPRVDAIFLREKNEFLQDFWIDTPQWNLVFNALSTRSEVPSSCTDGRANISRAEPHLSWWMNSTRGKRKICWYTCRRYGFDFGVSCPFKFPFLPFSSTSLLPPITEQNSWTAKCWGTTVICSSVMSNCLISTFQY